MKNQIIATTKRGKRVICKGAFGAVSTYFELSLVVYVVGYI
jgi:hypothetical protein